MYEAPKKKCLKDGQVLVSAGVLGFYFESVLQCIKEEVLAWINQPAQVHTQTHTRYNKYYVYNIKGKYILKSSLWSLVFRQCETSKNVHQEVMSSLFASAHKNVWWFSYLKVFV